MTTALLFGSTGAVGSQILGTLLASEKFTKVFTVSRRAPVQESARLQAILEQDTSSWARVFSELTPNGKYQSPVPSTVFNAVGTTRAAAGGVDKQRLIDHDLCIEVARAAKDSGVKTYVFVSSAGVSSAWSPFSYVPYARMKVGVETAIKDLGFDHAIILRPGMILGREKAKNAGLEWVFANLNRLGQGVQDAWGQDQTVIARAAVAAARVVEEGRAPSKYWILEQAEIVRMGRDEWEER